jgi:hypothetical protein
MGGVYKYAVEMGSFAEICVPSLIKIGSGIQKFMKGIIQRHTDRMEIA